MSRKYYVTIGAAIAFFALTASVVYVGVEVLQQQKRERLYESRHPLFDRGATSSGGRSVRIVSFGSSSTWGAFLEKRGREKRSYPFRIIPSKAKVAPVAVRNVAMKDGTGVLEAACTQSIVGDEIYDVITVEFQHTFDRSYEVLAQRLRQRFPEATIIFVQLWTPSQLTFTSPNDATQVNFTTWRHTHAPGIALHSSSLSMSIFTSGPENWSVARQPEVAEKRLRKTMERVGAGLVQLPWPSSNDFVFPQNLHSFLTFFNEDTDESSQHHYLSEEGHEIIASGLRKAISSEDVVTAILKKDLERRNQIGSWGSGDKCNLWYYHGQFEKVISTGRRLGFAHSTTPMTSNADGATRAAAVDSNHKHALEFRRNEMGHLTVSNPFPEARFLYLTYMTSNDEEDARVYPRTRVRLNGKPSVILDPYHDEIGEHHLTRTSVVGMIEALSETVVNLDPLDESSQLHFRLVGASILAEEAIGVLPIDFTLEPEPAKEPRPSTLRQVLRL